MNMEKDFTAFAAELVATPSTSLSEGRVADLVQNKMTELRYDRVLRDDVGNVVGIMFGRAAEPNLLLNCHMDTVGTSAESPFGTPPPDGTHDDERVYGRGAADCKGGLAAQIYAGALVKRSLLPLKGNLIVAATVAEENGLGMGVRALIERTLPELGMKPTYAILGEPTDLNLYYGHDGWIDLDINVEGRNPFQVDDAARAIYEDLDSRAAFGAHGEPDQSVTVFEPRFEGAWGTRRATIRTTRRVLQADAVDEVMQNVKHEASLVARNAGSVAVSVLVPEDTKQLYNGTTATAHRLTAGWAIDPFHPLMNRARQILTAAACKVQPGKWQMSRLGMGDGGQRPGGQVPHSHHRLWPWKRKHGARSQ